MAGGTFTTFNKVRPGVYMNFKSEPQPLGALGDRGVATIPASLPWGPSKEVIRLEAGEDTYSVLGYPRTAPELLLIHEALKRAKTLLLYRLNTGVKAGASDGGNLTVTARHGGVRGNDISIVIAANVDNPAAFDVATRVSGAVVEEQRGVAAIEQLQDNDWVTFSGTGAMETSAGIPLTGGENGTVTNQDYVDYLEAIELHDFNTMAYPGTDNTLKGVFTSFCRRLREEEGKKIQVVLENYPTADYEGVISVKNGVVLAGGTAVSAAQATAWTAGAVAAARVNESLTYASYDGAVDALPRYTSGQIIAALQSGEFVFTPGMQKVIVEQDLNTFTSFTPDRGQAFAKNRVIRVLDTINNDLVRIFSDFYVGKVPNSEDGRGLLKGECVNYLESLQNIGAIQDFDSQTDIRLSPIPGQSDAVYIETYVRPVDSIEKIYIQVEVGGAV